MDHGQLASATAMRMLEQRLDHIAQNLANADTPAYKGVLFVVETHDVRNGRRSVSEQPRSVLVRDFSQGAIVDTENPRELALDGEGFFVIEGEGGARLTRRLQLSVEGDGTVSNSDGSRVLGDGGSISVPASTSVITADPEGNVLADGNAVGRLRIMTLSEPSLLTPDKHGTYQVDPSELVPATARVVAGARERGNVDVVSEMVAMMATLRLYQASQRAMQTENQATQKLTTS